MGVFSSVAIVLLGVGLVLQAVGSWGDARRQRARLADRLTTLHDKIDAIAEHLDARAPVADHADLVALLADGRKIEAVSTYRRTSGADLAEAARFVEVLDRRRLGRDGGGTGPRRA